MTGQARPDDEVEAEHAAIIQCLVEFFEARDRPPLLPRFAIKGKTVNDLEIYDTSVPVADIVAAVSSTVNKLRAMQSRISSRYKVGSEQTVMAAFRAIARGDEAVFNRHDAFITLAAGYGVSVSERKVLRRHGLPPAAADSSRRPAVDDGSPADEGTAGRGIHTRESQREVARREAAHAHGAALNVMSEEELMIVGRTAAAPTLQLLLAGHVQASGSIEAVGMGPPKQQLQCAPLQRAGATSTP